MTRRRLPRDYAPVPRQPPKPKPTRPPNLSTWTAEEIAMLGVVPDKVIASRTGRRLQAVSKARRSLGLLPVGGWRGGRKKAEGEASDGA